MPKKLPFEFIEILIHWQIALSLWGSGTNLLPWRSNATITLYLPRPIVLKSAARTCNWIRWGLVDPFRKSTNSTDIVRALKFTSSCNKNSGWKKNKQNSGFKYTTFFRHDLITILCRDFFDSIKQLTVPSLVSFG